METAIYLTCLSDLIAVLALNGKCIVCFNSSWSPKKNILSLLYKDVYNIIINRNDLNKEIIKIYYLCSNGNDEIEDFVLNIPQIKSFPFIAGFNNDGSVSFVYNENINYTTLYNNIDNFYQFNNYDNINLKSPIDVLFKQNLNISTGKLFISGDKSSVGKSTVCLAILSSLIHLGVQPKDLAYIKPVTQCEAEQLVTQYCIKMGIEHCSIGPVVFYKGFTRAYLANETETSEELILKIIKSVDDISHNKKLTIVDGVGYPSVGSICNISNADVAKSLNCPVLLVGKSGVGDAVDSYNLNARFFECSDVTVLGGIFNKLPIEGFYSLENCKSVVTSYFSQWRSNQTAYGFLPNLNNSINFENEITESFIKYVDMEKLIFDIWNYNLTSGIKVIHNSINKSNSTIINEDVDMSININRFDTKKIRINNNSNHNNLNINYNDNQIKKKRQREDIENTAILTGAVSSK